MSVMVEMWVRGERERIDTALWQLEEAVAGSVRTTDKWLSTAEGGGSVDGWFTVEVSDVIEDEEGCEAVRQALEKVEGSEELLFGGPCFPDVDAPERQ